MAEPAATLRKAISPTDLTRRIRRLLEDNIRHVWVEGEISEYKVHRPSGHHYFSLKDEETTLNCAMWRSFSSRLRFKPEVGLEVLAFGRVDIYPPRSTYQLLVEKMEPKGIGALQIRFEELKKKLKKEGLFDEARKRELPPYPATIAIVTSPTGAAVRDMLRILDTRFPKVRVLIHPVLVQGKGAAEQIAAAIEEINALPDVDAMIVGRGGGSLEDLWAFNEEVVARAIFGSRIPVVSAVGHEIDFTIADFVADVRAATPTDAANRVVPDLRDLMETLRQYEDLLARRPRELYEMHAMRVDELHERLRTALPRLLQETRRRLDVVRLMDHAMDRLLTESRQRVAAAAGKLDALSPLRVLGRGYSITQDATGRVVRSASALQPGDEIHTRLESGRVRSRVEETIVPKKARS